MSAHELRAPKRVAVLGSTGSIGTQALEVIAAHPRRFTVVGLAAGRNVERLAEQVVRYRPRIVSAATSHDATELAVRLDAHLRIHGASRDVEAIAHGASGLAAVALASKPDIVLAATDGAVAFDAVFAAVDAGIDVAIANKELVVAAGELLFARARASGARLLPVDSEHSAIFQCLNGAPPERIAGIVLTASGGPFWSRSLDEIANARVDDALRHPTWQMGVKNTIDSASLMNKGLEVIEASRFFGLPGEKIGVLVHRTSVAHGFAVFTDGNVVGQFAPPDMRLPIGYALAYPDRLDDARPFDPLAALGGDASQSSVSLTFERPDERFPCLQLAYRALALGGTAPAALSAANEVAVEAFVAGKIRFGEIAPLIERAMNAVPSADLSLEAVRDADRAARAAANSFVSAGLAPLP